MDKFQMNDVLNVLATVKSNKRYSKLSHKDLLEIWDAFGSYVEKLLLQHRSVSIPGIGIFHSLKSKHPTENQFIPVFCPAASFERIPGFRCDKIIVAGAAPAEPLRFADVSIQLRKSRDDIESGLKDIILALNKILNRGSTVVLNICGKLIFQDGAIKMKFNTKFLRDYNKISVESSNRNQTIQELHFKKDSIPQIESVNDVNLELAKAFVKPVEPKPIPVLLPIVEKNEIQNIPMKNTIAEKQNPVVEETAHKNHELQNELAYLEVKTHIHPYTGDRSWKPSCPICRINGQTPVFQTNTQKLEVEKNEDKLLLLLSLEMDMELMSKQKNIDMKRQSVALSISKFNLEKAIEKEQERKSLKRNLPMGNLFENRIEANDHTQSQNDLAAALYGQIKFKRELENTERLKNEIEDIKNQEKLSLELKNLEIDSHIRKIEKWKTQRNALAEQIAIKNEINKKETEKEVILDNPYARSEHLLNLYKKQKAKQLLDEQMEILRVKREYASKMEAIDNEQCVNRLHASRKAYEHDIKVVRASKIIAEMTENKELHNPMQVLDKSNDKNNHDYYSDETDSIDMDEVVSAIMKIQRAWRSHYMKKTFKWLKEHVQRAESTNASSILKRLSPKECHILNDPVSNLRIRFRFGGESFPPIVMYKIFSKAKNVHYFSGHGLIQSGSKASIDSFLMMGARSFAETVKLKEDLHQRFGICERYEIGNRLEFVKYLNSLDERPSHMGGRSNNWRTIEIGNFEYQNLQFKPPKPSKKKSPPRISVAKTPKITNNEEEEEEFGMLFEWTNTLSPDNLRDYEMI